jgi:hypothetical protein
MPGVRILRAITIGWVLSASLLLSVRCSAAQERAAGSIEVRASVRPTEGQSEPVRGMTFYLLSRSLSDIRKEIENAEGALNLDHFVAQLDVSAELKEWMKKHHRVDLAGRDFTKELSPDDILDVPEFLGAYKDQNGSALHAVLPDPKYKAGDEQKNPEKYKLHQEQYRQALRRYIQANIDSLETLDAELRDLNPYPRWAHLQTEQQRRIDRQVLQLAQTRYLAGKAASNLNGLASFDNIPAGQYWISNLDTPALAGDMRLHWDTDIAVASAQTAHIELSNLNALESSEPNVR